MTWYVYLLECSDLATYVGATINVNRRLRQHNGEIKGGAKLTSIKVQKGGIWQRVCYISGFPSWQAALQFEWRWKQLSRKITHKCTPTKRRFIALQKLLSLESSTTKAIPFHDWETLPDIHFELDSYKSLYQSTECDSLLQNTVT